MYPPVSLWAKGDLLEGTVAMVEIHQLNAAGVSDVVMTSASVDEQSAHSSAMGPWVNSHSFIGVGGSG